MRKHKAAPPALKHGGYAGSTILPGEDESAFSKLYQDLIQELTPSGPLEEEIVMTITRLVWRKQNLKIYDSIQRAEKLFDQRLSEHLAKRKLPPIIVSLLPRDSDYGELLRSVDEETLAGYLATIKEIREHMGADGQLTLLADVATIPNLLSELAVVDRLDGMIDRCIKRLLMVRGVKSLIAAQPEPTRNRLIAQ
ncbi:MAG: hypothetical protein ACLQFW_10690 [Xanthobacteraceae bacterium]